jgi:hypothetical protein
MSGTVAAAPGTALITMQYDDAGTEWVIMMDNAVLAWDASASPVKPVIIGTMPPEVSAPSPPEKAGEKADAKAEAKPKAPANLPQWAVRESGMWIIPDTARGPLAALFSWLATGNGQNRLLYAEFADPGVAAEYQQWAEMNAANVAALPPNTPQSDIEAEVQKAYDLKHPKPKANGNGKAQPEHAVPASHQPAHHGRQTHPPAAGQV